MGLGRTIARTAVISGTATATSNKVNRRSAKKNAALQNSQPAPAPQQVAPTTGSAEDVAQELAKFKAMVDQGLISSEDYEAKKKEILGL